MLGALANIVGISKTAYVLATSRCLDWRHGLQQTSRNHYGSWAGPSAITFGRNRKPTYVFGAYDNLIARFGPLGKALRAVLQALEKTPLKELGLSHFWVVEKTVPAIKEPL